MRRLMTSALLILAIPFALVAAPIDSDVLRQINANITELLKPYNGLDRTYAETFISMIDQDKKRVNDIEVMMAFSKAGSVNEIDILIEDLSYHYGDGARPVVTIKGLFATDFVKAFGQEALNKWGPMIEGYADYIREGIKDEYGDSAELEVTPVLEYDDNGDINSASLVATFDVDLSKVPADSLKNIWLAGGTFNIAMNRNGGEVEVQMEMNPAYSGFSSEERGLREIVEELIAGEGPSYKEINAIFREFNQVAEDLVNEDSSQP